VYTFKHHVRIPPFGSTLDDFRLQSKTMATKHVAVRLDEQTLVRVDALIPSLSTPWRTARRSDVLRALILSGLEAQARGGPAWPARPTAAPTPPGRQR
jgi:hypothetical protein